MLVDDRTGDTAIRRQEERLARDPSSVAFAQLADLYRKAGRMHEAVAVCREGLRRYPRYTTARLILAKAYLSDGRLDEALAELATVLEVSPKDAQPHRLAAEAHRLAGRLDEAVVHLDAAVMADPDDRESRALAALLRAAPGSDADGQSVRRLLRDDVFATVCFGNLCLEQGLVEEAVQVFARILRQNAGSPGGRDGLERALRARLRRKG